MIINDTSYNDQHIPALETPAPTGDSWSHLLGHRHCWRTWWCFALSALSRNTVDHIGAVISSFELLSLLKAASKSSYCIIFSDMYRLYAVSWHCLTLYFLLPFSWNIPFLGIELTTSLTTQSWRQRFEPYGNVGSQGHAWESWEAIGPAADSVTEENQPAPSGPLKMYTPGVNRLY